MKKIKNSGLIIIFFIVLTLVFVTFYLVNLKIQDENIKKFTKGEVNEIKFNFNQLETSDIKMLSSTLEIIIQDPRIKEIYLEKNRTKLYNYTFPLFEELKNKYGITHWYFILPEGHTFLRVHNKKIYGDEITRFTFYKSRDTKNTSSGIELGKTAYALRVVMPYYDEGNLIGYVELGQEIDSFLDILKNGKGSEFIFLADKQYLDKTKWSSVRKVAGLRDNWDDFSRYVLIGANPKKEIIFDCIISKNMLEGEKGKVLFQVIKQKNRIYRCAGIPLIDAGDRQSGVIFSLIDINSYGSFVKNSNLIILGFLILIFIIIVLMNYLLFKFLEKPK